MLSRRGFLGGFVAAAPAVILTPKLLMPVRSIDRRLAWYCGRIIEDAAAYYCPYIPLIRVDRTLPTPEDLFQDVVKFDTRVGFAA